MNCECHGVERESYASENKDTGITIHRSSLEDIQFDHAYFDAVIIWHVLEHLYRPIETLDEATRIIKDGGLVAIAVPNFSSLQSRWFKSGWFHLDLPRHLYHFDPDNLDQALTQRGFVVQSISTCSVEQNLFGFMQSLMNSFKFLGRSNTFYRLLKQHSGFTNNLKLAGWLVLGLLVFPFTLAEFLISCVLNKGASVIVFAKKEARE